MGAVSFCHRTDDSVCAGSSTKKFMPTQRHDVSKGMRRRPPDTFWSRLRGSNSYDRQSMKQILLLDLGLGKETRTISFAGQEVSIHHVGTDGNPDLARQLVLQADAQVDAIALEGMPAQLKLGAVAQPHHEGAALREHARRT